MSQIGFYKWNWSTSELKVMVMVRYIFKTRANWWRYKLWTNNDRNQLINMKYSGTHIECKVTLIIEEEL